MALPHQEPEPGRLGRQEEASPDPYLRISSPETHASASLGSRMSRLLKASRAGAEPEPEPNGDRRASGRKPRAVPAGVGFQCARLVVSGARGGGASRRVRSSGLRRRRRLWLSLCLRVCWPARRKCWRSRVFFFFLPPTGFWVLVFGCESGFWKSMWKMNGK